ncbi:MAG: hypothetical protein K6B46_02310 [Opitutales bacterium]|nr:hypothetical protein [Opitutales bacterium]
MEIAIIVIVNALLAAACVAGTAGALKKTWRLARQIAAGTLLSAGTLQIFFFGMRGLGNGILPIYNLFEVFFALSLCGTLAFLFLRIVWEIRVPAVACAWLSFALALLASLNKQFWDVEGVVSWLPVHVGLLLVGVACLGSAALAWALYFLQDRALRRRQADSFSTHLPDLISLERVGRHLLTSSLVFFVAGVAVGILNIFAAPGGMTLFIVYKILISALILGGLVALYFLRRRQKISARAGTVFGIAIFLLTIILIGGIDGVRKYSARAEQTELVHESE